MTSSQLRWRSITTNATVIEVTSFKDCLTTNATVLDVTSFKNIITSNGTLTEVTSVNDSITINTTVIEVTSFKDSFTTNATITEITSFRDSFTTNATVTEVTSFRDTEISEKILIRTSAGQAEPATVVHNHSSGLSSKQLKTHGRRLGSISCYVNHLNGQDVNAGEPSKG
ncbi:uncharacterized protein [Palaemon carinicauda]|uniref:uncharacterized protein n=1 Tax=Palaemon carinicauda TaxID=392227 RepID=UPI0035B6801E